MLIICSETWGIERIHWWYTHTGGNMFLKDYWRDGRNLSHMYTHTCKCPHTAASRVLIQAWKCLFYWLECEQCRKKQQCVGMPLSEEKLKHNISESVALRKWKSDWSHQWAHIKRARGLADGDVAGKWKRKQDRGQMRSPQESGVHVRGHKNHF